MHRKRFLAHVGIASLVGMGGMFGADRSAPALVGAYSRSRRFDEPDNKEPTVDELKAQLAAARADVAKFKGDFETTKTERDAAAAKLADIDRAALSESDRLKAEKLEADGRATKAETKAQEASLQIAVERACRKLNVVDEEVAFTLLDKSGIKFGADGKPTGVTEALEALVKAKPFLIASDDNAGPGGPSNPPRNRGGGGMSAIDIINADFDKSGRKSAGKL